MDLLKLFGKSKTESYPADTIIFNEGEPAEVMYIVLEGVIEIRGATDEVFETISSGDVFGEMALIDDKPRSAKAVVCSDCTLVKIDEKLFLYMVQKIPMFSLHIMRIITKRLRHMNTLRMLETQDVSFEENMKKAKTD